MCNQEKEFKQNAFGFLHKPNPVHIVLEETPIDYCYRCEEERSKDKHLYEFGSDYMCRECLIIDMMVDLEEGKFSRDEELATWYYNQGVDLSDAKDMIKAAWNNITERNLALREKPITDSRIQNTINHLQNKAA